MNPPTPSTVLARLRSAAGNDLEPAVLTRTGREWSRHELLDRAATGAARLDADIGPTLLGICLPEGGDLAVSVLAAMGAGGAAPVRADLPAEAIAAHLIRTGVGAVVATTDSPAARVADDLGLVLVTPDDDEVFRFRRPPPGRPRDGRSDAGDVALVLTTSGTTGEPKVVPLRHVNIVSSVDRIIESLALSPQDRSLVVMPLTHIHGMVAGFLAPLAAGGAVFLNGPFDPRSLPDAAAGFGTTFVTAVPTMHRALVALPAGARWSEDLRFLRSSSSAMPATVAESLERRFDVPVLEAYGMTEAAHQIISNTVDDTRRGSVGRAAVDRVRVVDADGHGLETDTVGDVVIRGDNVMAGYVGGPQVNEASFVDGWFRTGDLGRIGPDGHLVLVGRTKEMINRGGETIAPGPIEEVLRGVAGVRDAVVFAMPHPSLGEHVAAAVVTENGSIPVRALQREVGRRLGEADVPRVVHVVEEIPVGPTGKVQRNLLSDLFGGAPVSTSVGALDPVESEVADAWCQVGLSPTGPDDDFIALGGDSLTAIAVAFDLGQRWGSDVRPVDLLRDTTLSGMASLRFRSPPSSVDALDAVVEAPSMAQRRMVAADRLGIDIGASHMAFAWSIDGALDVDRLRRAVEVVIARHPALRRAFVVAPTFDYRPLTVERAHEWIDGGKVRHLDEASTGFRKVAARVYDLDDGPLARFALWRLESADRWLFGFAYHHAVLDGRSRRVVLDDIAAAFAGDPLSPPGPPVATRRRSLSETDAAWWSDRFRGVPLELDWTTRRPADAVDTGTAPVLVRLDLDESTDERLRRTCVAHHVTPTMVLVAATALGLHRLTGDDTVAVGLAVDHRLPARDTSVGVTFDSAPVVVDVARSGTTAELLGRVRRDCLDVYERSESGFDEIRRAAGRRYDEPILHARAQVRTDSDELQLDGLRLESMLLDPVGARAPVSLDLRIAGDGVTLDVVFDTRVIDARVAGSFARTFASILDSLLGAADRPLEAVEWVSPTDRALVAAWGSGPQGDPAFPTVDAWFRHGVGRWPKRTAVRSFDRDITFTELDELVDRVALGLVSRTSAGDAIASLLPGSLDQVVLQLAAWRVGRAVVAVDADGPDRRTQAHVGAASVRLVVVEDGSAPVPPGHRSVVFDDLLATPVPADLVASSDSDATAWGCLTSGSTGEPNLVLGTQSNLVHLVHAWQQVVPPDAIGVATVSKPASAVGFLSEWMVPLLGGSTLFFLNRVTARDPFRIAIRLREFAVTWYRGTPLMLHAVAAQVLALDGPNRRVKLVVSGADRLSRRTADLLAEAFPAAVVVNQYGCTEATAETTLGRVDRGSRDPDIGRPLANVRLEVVDERGHAVPPGTRGEIVIDGPLVTPLADGGRRHRSGDLGWWDGEGRLHFVGRCGDSRLSVNGNRIDAGEIETALVSTGLVSAAVVTVDPAATGGTGLAAVVTLCGEHSAAEIRAAVAAFVPAYAIPNRIAVVEAIPMLANGKIDHLVARAVLADADADAGANTDTEAEAHLAALPPHLADIRAVVANVLGRPPATVDTTRSLQANGGDSFAAIALQEQLFAIRGVRLDIAPLLDDRPLAELADEGVASVGEALPGRLRRISFGENRRRVIWFPGGGGLDVEVRRLVHHLAAPPEILVYPYPGAELGERPKMVFRRLVEGIVDTLEGLEGPAPVVAGNSFGGVVAVEVASILQRRRPGWIEGLLIVDALPIEHRRRVRGGRFGLRARADLRGLLVDRGREDLDPAVRWRRNFRASRVMLDTHRRSGAVTGIPVVVLATAERRRVTGRPDLGWSERLGDSVRVIELPGDHGGLLVEPKVVATAAAVTAALQYLAPVAP